TRTTAGSSGRWRSRVRTATSASSRSTPPPARSPSTTMPTMVTTTGTTTDDRDAPRHRHAAIRVPIVQAAEWLHFWDGAVDEVFKALADPSRRRLLDSLNARNGQTLRELCSGLDMARQSVSKHLAVLEAAHLVTTARRGREKLHYLNAAPINAIADRWMSRYDRDRARAPWPT